MAKIKNISGNELSVYAIAIDGSKLYHTFAVDEEITVNDLFVTTSTQIISAVARNLLAVTQGASSVYDAGIKGKVAVYSALPTSGVSEGDIYVVENDEGANNNGLYKYSGGSWTLLAELSLQAASEVANDSAVSGATLADALNTISDHGNLNGLGDDDHAQYINEARHDITARHTLGTVVPHDDHSNLSGLSNDDHAQYLTNARGDARYYQQTEFVATSAGVGDAGKPVVLDADGQVDATMINSADVDHTAIQNVGSNTHAQIDAHIANTSNPHSVVAAQAGYTAGAAGDWAVSAPTDIKAAIDRLASAVAAAHGPIA